uniref:Uncharacterized protein n=1 Tax=Megaselia scalaris TaxID=36166 RepID=T1H3U7_MEGSC
MEKKRVLIFLVLISLVSFLINLSNAKLCAEESCKSVIATGVTTVRSSPKAKGYLGFRPNVPVKILSRKDGPKSDLCLVEIQGQVGLVSHKHILEKKIIIRMEDLIEIAEVPKEEEEQIQIKPSIKDIEPTHTESLPQVNPTQNIVTQGDSSNVSEEVSSEATPVVEESEIVDGTQLPVELDDKVTLLLSLQGKKNLNSTNLWFH